MTAFLLASIKYLCVRLRSLSSFFSRASWDVDKLSKYFIITSEIMELTSTMSGRASASGVRQLRGDKVSVTKVIARMAWGRRGQHNRVAIVLPAPKSRDRTSIRGSSESSTSQRISETWGEGAATGFCTWAHSSGLQAGHESPRAQGGWRKGSSSPACLIDFCNYSQTNGASLR